MTVPVSCLWYLQKLGGRRRQWRLKWVLLVFLEKEREVDVSIVEWEAAHTHEGSWKRLRGCRPHVRGIKLKLL